MGGLRNYDKKEIRFMVHKRLSRTVIAIGRPRERERRMNEAVVIITLDSIFQNREETDARMDSKN